MIYFSKTCYDVYYHLVKFQTPPKYGETKKINCIGGRGGYPNFGYSPEE